MAKKIVETLVTELTADGAKLKAEMEKSFKDAKSWGDRMSKVAKNVAIFGGAGAVGIGAGVVALTKNAIDNADAMSKQSQAVGMAIDKLSAYSYAAEMGGVQQEQFVASLGKFNRVIAEAFQGVGKGVDAFDALGISITDNNGKLKNNSDLFAEVADRFKSMPDGIEKSALAMDLFGRSGAALIPTLNGGKESLVEMTAEAERLGLVISEDTGKKAELFNDNLEKMQKAFSGLGNRIAEESLPALIDFTDRINDPQTQQGLADISSGIITLGTWLVDAASKLADFTGKVGEFLAKRFNGINILDVDDLESEIADVKKILESPMVAAFDVTIPARLKFQKGNGELDSYYNMLLQTRDDIKKGMYGSNTASGAIPKASPTASGELNNGSSVFDPFLDAPGALDYYEWQAQQGKGGKKPPKVSPVYDPFLDDNSFAQTFDQFQAQQEAADQEVAIQRDKFRRIHEEKLAAQGLDIELETYQYQRAQEQLEYELNALREKNLLTEELQNEFRLAEEDLEIAHQERLKEIKDRAADEDMRRRLYQLQAAEQLAGSLYDISAEFGGKQTRLTRTLFAFQKVASIAQAGLAIKAGIAKAVNNDWPTNLVAMGSVISATSGLLSDMDAINIAHGGLDSVPKESTYLLDKGERVVSPEQNRDLTNFLKEPDSKKFIKPAGVNVTIQNFGSPKNFSVEKLSENEVRIIARDEAMQVVQKETGNLVSRDIADPNSKVSKSLARNTQTQRNR